MDSELQLNISAPAPRPARPQGGARAGPGPAEYSFVSRPAPGGRTLARRRQDPAGTITFKSQKSEDVPKLKKTKILDSALTKTEEVSNRLRELSENKGKYQDKNYQDLNDDLQTKAKPRSGGWVSSLFKNNPTVPRIGQRLVKPIVEKVFSGKTFSDLDIHPHSVANLQQNLALKELMTVQQKASPIILQGRDVLVRSQTGSGKTLAYALPIIEGLQAIRPKITRHDGILVVVVVPTRELAVQTYELFVKLVKPFTWIVPGLLSGGQKRKAEKARLRKGLSILVGTPGRICDHLRHTQSLNFAKTRCLVLDEADRLLDMGYEKDVAAIVEALSNHKTAATYDPLAMVKQSVKKTFPDNEEHVESQEKEEQEVVKHHLTEVLLSNQRQTILLSATLTKAVENLAGLTMVDPVFVDTSEGRASLVVDSLKKDSPPVILDTKDIESNTKDIKPEEKTSLESINPISTKLTNDEEINKNRQGLKQFSGSTFPDLFTPSQNKNKSFTPEKPPTPVLTANEESDSDSDYEFFKIQKELAVQKKEDSPEVEEPDESGNNFQEAIQNALEEDELMIPVSVVQNFLITPMKLRLVTLCAIIVQHCVLNKKGGKMIVFMATTEMVDYHADLLETVLTEKSKSEKKKSKKPKKMKKADNKSEEESESSQEEVDSDFEVTLPGEPGADGLVPVQLDIFKLHGSMPHPARMDVFQKFRAARSGLLLCTDVAARGLDLPRVDLVLQYCAPASATDYVHRVGRTGRATHVGAATLLLLPSEAEFVRYLEEKRIRLRQEDDRTVLDSLRSLAPAANSGARAAVATQASLEHLVTRSKEWLTRASRAYTSWVRFYAGYPRGVKPYLDSKQLHLGHAAKAFALRDPPGTVARRAKSDPQMQKERPSNRLTVDAEREKKRPGFPKLPLGAKRPASYKQSSMHSASEFDSGLPPVEKKRKK